MNTASPRKKSWNTDARGFLRDAGDWDEGFAEEMAPGVGIGGGLTPRHWEVIRFIRDTYHQSGECPLVFTTCRAMDLRLREMESLFPSGYLRGACLLAGVTYRDRFVDYFGEPPASRPGAPESAAPPASGFAARPAAVADKAYRTDVLGFLVDPEDWDEAWVVSRAREMRLPGGLTPERFRILTYLRDRFFKTGAVPTVIQCCRDNGMEMDDLEELFPNGYHRGAVKLAGLCVRSGVSR